MILNKFWHPHGWRPTRVCTFGAPRDGSDFTVNFLLHEAEAKKLLDSRCYQKQISTTWLHKFRLRISFEHCRRCLNKSEKFDCCWAYRTVELSLVLIRETSPHDTPCPLTPENSHRRKRFTISEMWPVRSVEDITSHAVTILRFVCRMKHRRSPHEGT